MSTDEQVSNPPMKKIKHINLVITLDDGAHIEATIDGEGKTMVWETPVDDAALAVDITKAMASAIAGK